MSLARVFKAFRRAGTPTPPETPAARRAPAFKNITPADAAARLSTFRIVDVREAAEFGSRELGHLAASVNVPLSRVGQASAQWAAEAPILLVCRSGRRSGLAADGLARQGFLHVHNLAGGLIAWHRSQLPVAGRKA